MIIYYIKIVKTSLICIPHIQPMKTIFDYYKLGYLRIGFDFI